MPSQQIYKPTSVFLLTLFVLRSTRIVMNVKQLVIRQISLKLCDVGPCGICSNITKITQALVLIIQHYMWNKSKNQTLCAAFGLVKFHDNPIICDIVYCNPRGLAAMVFHLVFRLEKFHDRSVSCDIVRWKPSSWTLKCYKNRKHEQMCCMI